MKTFFIVIAGVILFTPLTTRADSLTDALVRLSICESRRTTHIKYLDSDGYYSYGVLQFHRGTLERNALKYGMRNEIAEEDLYNPDLQFRVARAMLLDNPENYRQWLNCARITHLDQFLYNELAYR